MVDYSRPKKRTIHLEGQSTSISLETDFWEALVTIAKEREQSVSKLVHQIRDQRTMESGLATAVRSFVLKDMRERKMHDRSSA
jgi:predicted DNA-binding ribbon-helix-helix protein